MKIFGITTILAISIFLAACGADQVQQTAVTNTAEVDGELTAGDDYWAKDNLDLGRVGELLEESDNPAEFEAYLNSDDGINNLDLNGDGYADYISVEEFDDRYDDQRGLSLFARFGPDIIQEIATIVFHRDDYNAPGARILLRGNPQIYGDGYYYETNWLDRSLGIVSALFSDDRDIYRSPYYYGYYPDDYELYQIVETPVYRTRIEQLYPTTVFIQTDNPSVKNVKIRSKYKDKWMDNVHAKLVKPTKEQAEFKKKNPKRPEFVKVDKPGKMNPQGDDRGRGNDKNNRPDNDDRGQKGRDDNPGKGGPPADKGPDKSAGKGNPGKPDGKGSQKGGNGKGKKD